MDRPSPYIAATPTSPPHLYSNSELQQSLVSPPPPPPANSPPPRQHPASSPPRLRTSQSFRVDEGYSEETPVVEDIRRSHYFTTDKVTLPDWMTGLSDSLREGNLFILFSFMCRIVAAASKWLPVFSSTN